MPRRASIQPSLRIEPALHRRLERAAKKNNRSINQEMTRRLADSFFLADLISFQHSANDIEQATAKLTAIVETLDKRLQQAPEAQKE